ncbi:MAG TPA: ATP-binding protein [Bryobacteraceae bacterium]|jgi:PAS domain S-box-containing protein
MTIPIRRQAPLEEENERLRARIAELEEEIARVRGAAESPHGSEAEALLREIEIQYKEVFENISVCMFLIDVTPEGRFRYAAFNPAEEKAVGLSNAQISGRFVEDIFPEQFAKKLTANYRRCLDSGAPIAYDDELSLPVGKRYFHSNLIPVRNAAGRIHRIVGACIDITDFRRTQQEALASQKLEGLGVLAGGIAHDFNNLLGGILANSELLLEDLPPGSPVREGLESINAVAVRAAEIVRELMAYAGHENTVFEAVDLSNLAGEMLQLLKVSISKNAVLDVNLPKNLPTVRANPGQIRQVVMNLITNASEALGEGAGAISISTGLVHPANDSVAGVQNGEYVRVTVGDTGCGMTKEVQARIFDPFFTTKFAGRGLGLAAVQGIVRGHGGAIDVESEPGQGSRIEIRLPVRQTSRDGGVAGTGASANKAGSAARSVLVIEDEPALRIAVSKMLQKSGFTVSEAGDGRAGVDLFRAHEQNIDVVLLDMTLPGMSGREVLGELRRIRPDVQVILTTAYSQDRALTVLGGQQPWFYIRKPYQLGELAALLHSACQGRPA